MLDLGAKLIHKVGLGDYQHDFNYEGEFDPWMGSLWSSIDSVVAGKFIKTGELSKEDSERYLPPVYKVEIIGEIPDTEKHSTLNYLPPPNGAINS